MAASTAWGPSCGASSVSRSPTTGPCSPAGRISPQGRRWGGEVSPASRSRSGPQLPAQVPRLQREGRAARPGGCRAGAESPRPESPGRPHPTALAPTVPRRQQPRHPGARWKRRICTFALSPGLTGRLSRKPRPGEAGLLARAWAPLGSEGSHPRPACRGLPRAPRAPVPVSSWPSLRCGAPGLC